MSEDVLSLRELSVEFPAPLGRASAAELKRLRREVQIVLPDPCGGLDPRWTVERVIAIARGLVSSPRLVIADEPVSVIDVSIPAQIINLLLEIQRATGIAYLVISHDIALVHQVPARVVVLYLGRAVEEGPAEEVILAPRHPCTAVLEDAGPGRRVACFRPGELASTAANISGGAP